MSENCKQSALPLSGCKLTTKHLAPIDGEGITISGGPEDQGRVRRILVTLRRLESGIDMCLSLMLI